MPAAATRTTPSIASMLEEGQKAVQAGVINAAYLVVWGTLESAIEQVTEQSPLPISLLISYALNQGVVNQDEYLLLREALRNRNFIAHGQSQATEQDVYALSVIAERISSRAGSRFEDATVEPIREIVGGEPYDYFPLGEYVVRAPGVCGGRPTFKYTRIEPEGLLQCLTAGETFNDLIKDYGGRVSAEALQEAIDIKARPLLKEIGSSLLR